MEDKEWKREKEKGVGEERSGSESQKINSDEGAEGRNKICTSRG